MSLDLHQDLSFCEVDGRLFFLDIGKDRYFQLSSTLEQAFVASMNQRPCPIADREELIEAGILVDTQSASIHASPATIPPPMKSALERFNCGAPVSMLAGLKVLSIVLWTKLQLNTIGLKRTLRRLEAHRRSRLSRCQPAQALEATCAFRQARRYVPLETRCLLDSIALVKFLAMGGLHADIIFGVTSDPFAAHCWVQVDHTILNDTIGSISTYTPIRVI